MLYFLYTCIYLISINRYYNGRISRTIKNIRMTIDSKIEDALETSFAWCKRATVNVTYENTVQTYSTYICLIRCVVDTFSCWNKKFCFGDQSLFNFCINRFCISNVWRYVKRIDLEFSPVKWTTRFLSHQFIPSMYLNINL